MDADKYTEDVGVVYEVLFATETEMVTRMPHVVQSMVLLKGLLERVYYDGFADGYTKGLHDEPHV